MSKNIQGEWVLIGNCIYKKKPEGMFYIEKPIAKIFNTKEKKFSIRLNDEGLKHAFLVESAPELLKALELLLDAKDDYEYENKIAYAESVRKKAKRKNR